MLDFLSSVPHRRLNALTGDFVLVSPHRAKRPWQGKVEALSETARPAYDSGCYLCPNNLRANGERNPPYAHVYVFDNDFAALLPDVRTQTFSNDLFHAQVVQGRCRVICFSPRHDLTLAEMSETDIEHVVSAWQQETLHLGTHYQWIQIFENKGELMGCSNPHPHGQIWALNTLPNEARKEEAQQRTYFETHRRPLLLDYLQQEILQAERVILENGDWIALVPFWAAHPFETLLLLKRSAQRLTDLSELERASLADILKRLLVKYDNLFHTSFPYSMGWHQAPFGLGDVSHWQLHAHFYPPLLRSATVKKFIVGFELLGELQRDFTPEQAAEMLRAQSDIHYKLHSL
ncbi:MAG: UDP-glucose--hexose-1-phosphate uridylyltransferase [Chloroherpetonaceae bacterium]